MHRATNFLLEIKEDANSDTALSASVTQNGAAPVSAVIVNYNTREHLRACLATIQSDAPGEVIVVDNASTDDSVKMVQSDYPWVILHANHKNPGYGAAANQAIGRCTSPYVLLLNSDTLLQPGTLRALSAYLDQHPQVAIVGPRIVNSDGSLQVSSFPFPTPLPTLLSESNLPILIRRLPGLRHSYLPTWSHNNARRVPWVLGAALAIRKEAFEAVGGFDETFFMYFEEIDLCYRLQRAGWQTHFAPIAKVVHLGQASTLQRRAAMALQFYRSLYHFYEQHYTAWQILQLKLIMTYVMVRRILRDTLRLSWTNQPSQRERLAEDLQLWRSILGNFWPSTGLR